jgi:hypothetical protein
MVIIPNLRLLCAWDVFRGTMIWPIWCARCRIVFDQDGFNVAQVCQLVWRDTFRWQVSDSLNKTLPIGRQRDKKILLLSFLKPGVGTMFSGVVVLVLPSRDLTPKGPRPFFGSFLKFGHAIVDAIFVPKISNFQ